MQEILLLKDSNYPSYPPLVSFTGLGFDFIIEFMTKLFIIWVNFLSIQS